MSEVQDGLTTRTKDHFLKSLNIAVLWCVKLLAILMVLVVFWAVLDVIYYIIVRFYDSTSAIFDPENLIHLLGVFLAVLVAIEVFLNIVFYLKEDAVHVPLVLATALTAIARKVIVLDYREVSTDHMYATAALVFAIGVSYWLVTKK